MTYFDPRRFSVVDLLLADVVRKIQLTKTEYDLAVARYGTINDWLDREGSPLRGLVNLMYPQGSMAMGCTISSSLENDEYDIDIMAELSARLAGWTPREVLDTLYMAIRAEKGSRYYDRVVRNTRCVTVNYADMHLDVTPSMLIGGATARTSIIFHSKLEEHPSRDKRVIANPWGFAEWFRRNTPSEAGSFVSLAKASDAVPVQEQPSLLERSLPLMALQLIKRWRNKKYDRRDCRWPPSVLLACMVGEQSGLAMAAHQPRFSLYDELRAHVAAILAEMRRCQAEGQLVQRVNPECREDVFTDRWPEGFEDQATFISDLEDFNAKLVLLGTDIPLERKTALLSDLFGERVMRLAMDAFQERLDRESRGSGLLHATGVGSGRLLPAAPTIVPAMPRSGVQQAPKHTFYGGEVSQWPRRRS